MFCPRPCGCKGQRTCLLCEGQAGVPQIDSWVTQQEKAGSYIYCPKCDLAWPGWDSGTWVNHPNHTGEPVKFPGVKIVLDFVSEEEETKLLGLLDEVPWDLSQSGRRKQNYGPKCNFKKRRVKCDNFTGYPAFTKFIQDRFGTIELLKNFYTVEQCSLEYTIERGASIDPHVDDCWIWGERIPTLSMLTDSTLTLRQFSGPLNKYNLIDTKSYPAVINNGMVKTDEEMESEINELIQENPQVNQNQTKNPSKLQETKETDDKNGAKNHTTSQKSPEINGKNGEIENPTNHSQANDKNELKNPTNSQNSPESNVKLLRIPMPRRSLLILYGPSRYDWEHGILREDIDTRRVCITYRELTPPFLGFGPKADVGKPVLEAGKNFWDHRSYYGIET